MLNHDSSAGRNTTPARQPVRYVGAIHPRGKPLIVTTSIGAAVLVAPGFPYMPMAVRVGDNVRVDIRVAVLVRVDVAVFENVFVLVGDFVLARVLG